MKIKYFFLSFIIFSLFLSAKAQLAQDYVPIQFQGAMPEELVYDYVNITKEAAKKETALAPDKALKFYQNLYNEKMTLFNSGNVYYNDKLTAYVRNVADKLLVNNQEIKSRIRIYVTRYSSANAMALPDGSIFINVGLLANLNNEAQLAFIIAHEIAHVENKHALNEIVKLAGIKSQEQNNYNPEGNLFRMLKYSREFEFEADSKGLQLLLTSGYDANESPKALKILTDTIYKVKNLKAKMIKTFSSEIMTLDTSYFKENKSVTNENSDIVFNNRPDDQYETHPDMHKRMSALKEILSLTNYKSEGKALNLVNDEKTVADLRKISQFEIVENLYRNFDLYTSLYISFLRLENYPESQYLKTMIVKNLYWLAYYKEINTLDEILDKAITDKKESMEQMGGFIKNISVNELRKLLYGYAKQSFESLKGYEDFYLYYGLTVEAYVGKEPSKFIFIQYLSLFPDGKERIFVKAKTQ